MITIHTVRSKHRLPLLLLACLLLLLAAPAQAQDGQVTHVVQSGENLFRIALRYGLTADQVAAANSISDPTLIYVGQQLVIPIAGSAVPPVSAASTAANPAGFHIVQAGENVFRIGLKYGLTAQQIATANSLSSVSMIFVGQRLTIPAAVSAPPQTAPAVDGVRLAAPLYGQQRTLSCEATAARMLAEYYGAIKSEWWFQTALGLSDNPHSGFRGNVDGEFGWIDDYGVHAEPVARALLAAGIDAGVRYGMTYADLRAALDRKAPVIVWTSPRSDFYDMPAGYRLVPEEHTYVVVGYDSAGFIVHDPLYGGRRLKLASIPGWGLFDNMAVVGP
ncbi:MAG TPA: LysM peptidoglycan-binding domain-containing protein [Anaerolineae bacterium]|nr:LysM peptidoglycan-binding domain-containing protein [Anaerolineae bacterium]